jgi:hypothetical protein
MALSQEQLRALRILAAAGAVGRTETLLKAHGFATPLLAALVRDGLATAAQESVPAGHETTTLTLMRITDAGRQALAD